MGMGYAANFADVVESQDITAACPDAWKHFIDIMEAEKDSGGHDLDSLAMELRLDDVDEADPLYEAYEALCTEFEQTTGLTLLLGYHDHDDCGDRYDEINGYFWAVDGMYELTDAGRLWDNKVSRKFFVTFG